MFKYKDLQMLDLKFKLFNLALQVVNIVYVILTFLKLLWSHIMQAGGPGAVVEAASWKSRRSRVRTPLPKFSKKQNVSSQLTRKASIL